MAMKQVMLIILCLYIFENASSQGITLLYTGEGSQSFGDALNWIQINVPPGQTPVQRPPTSIDDVVFSKARSGVSGIGFVVADTLGIGGGSSSFCRRMYVYGMDIEFRATDVDQSGADVRVYTSTGGGLVLDSGTILHSGQFRLHGGNSDVAGLDVRDSKFGQETQHNRVNAELYLEDNGKARFKRSSFAGFYFGSIKNSEGIYANGGGIYADSSTFNAGSFIMGDNSVDTFTNSSIIPNGINDGGVQFLIGRNSSFVSENDTIFVHYGTLIFTTSGSVFNGNITGWYFNFAQEDTTHPLPNIINGDVVITEDPAAGISGDLKISGNITGYMPAAGFPVTPHVIVNGTNAFDIAGIRNFGDGVVIKNCVQDFCHYKLEFFGNKNSNIFWNVGFPVDTLIINKTGCAKVTCTNSLYVAGATRIESGQLALEPNENIHYKFVCAGNVDIFQGGGLFLRRNSNGIVANMAVAGTITDYNSTQDSTCEGLSNPYNGLITHYSATLPVTLVDFSGKYRDKSITLNWSTENELNTKYFTVEKRYEQVTFIPLSNVIASGNMQSLKNYSYNDKGFLKAVNYYRLKSVDADGRYSYSKIIAVAAPNDNAIILYPNPVRDKLILKLHDAYSQTIIRIADLAGRVKRQMTFNQGVTDIYINTADLPAGTYSLIIHSANLQRTISFIKE